MSISKKMIPFIAFLVLSVFLVSCNKDEDTTPTVRFEITDAPIDDISVEGAFVTISEIQVDGQPVQGFNRTTIDLLAYQNGATKLLAETELEAGTYNDVTLVLDYDQDANGNAPGCYVLEAGTNAKHKLSTTTNEIQVNHIFDLAAGSQTTLLLDVDLRKCITRENNGDDQYNFVTEAEMRNAIRIVNKGQAGLIEGSCEDNLTTSDQIIVYAYKKGEFDRNKEVQGQGESDITFANAVSSASVQADGSYELHFLEPGEYELHFCAYKANNDGEMQLQGTLIVNLLGELDLGGLSLEASGNLTADVVVTGILPL
jgi:hypothetical protein